MAQRPTRSRLELREEAKARYRDKKNIEAKWLDQYGNISLEDDYQRNRSCLSEVFNMLDVVMENCIEDFRQSHVLLSVESLGPRTAKYTFEGDHGKTVEFRTPSVFASRATALRAIGYTISNELFYDTRLLRNETTHGNQTIVLQHMQLSYADTMKAMLSMADTLIELGMLDASLRTPPFEKLRVRENETLSNGAYTVESLIGEGGMSRVYAATQTRIGRRIAIKELKPETYSEELIRNECDTLLRLHHDLIPQIHDVFYENATWYIAMSYVEGLTLDRFVTERAPLEDAVCRTICRSLLDILQYLHSPEVQIVFTDLAPDNIIVGSDNRPHLIDFGISSQIETRQTLPAATLGYSAPEVFTNSILDQRSDIYSFGYILRYLYTGLSPTEKREQPTTELVRNSRIAEVINRCTARNPGERYATVAELQAALFPEKSSETQAGKSRRPFVAAGALLAAAAVGMGIFASSRGRQDTETAQIAESAVSAESASETDVSAESAKRDTLSETADSAEVSTQSEQSSSADSEQSESRDSADTSTSAERSESADTSAQSDSSDSVPPSVKSDSQEPAASSARSESQGAADSSAESESQESAVSSETAEPAGTSTDSADTPDTTVSPDSVASSEATSPTDTVYVPSLSPELYAFTSEFPFSESGLANHVMEWNDDALEQSMRELTGITEGDILLSDVWNIQELTLQNCGISDVSSLAELTQLTALYLGGNPLDLDTAAALASLPELMILDLSTCGITDISLLRDFSGLQELYLGHNTITDLTPLTELSALTMLELQFNPLSENPESFTVLSGLTGITWLDLKDTGISDLSFLASLTALMNTDLSNNRISDLSPLSGLTMLEYLDVSDNAVTDLSALSGLTNLYLLYAFNNDITGDLQALTDLVNLNYLDLHKNHITDISALRNLRNLQILDLEDNDITDFSALTGIPLEEVHV